MKNSVDKQMTLGEVVQQFPAAAGIMMKYGLHCIGCHVATWETVEQGAMAHGMGPDTIDSMIQEINSTITKQEAQ